MKYLQSGCDIALLTFLGCVQLSKFLAASALSSTQATVACTSRAPLRRLRTAANGFALLLLLVDCANGGGGGGGVELPSSLAPPVPG